MFRALKVVVQVIVAASLSYTCIGQSVYYVSNAGNDSNTGKSEAQAFRTIDKINSLTLQAGDQVLFRRGDTFRGMLVLQQSGTTAQPISIDAFGSGSKPVISGSQPVTSWKNTSGKIWQATCSSCGSTVTGVYMNGRSLALGRYPNENDTNRGYLTVQSHSGKTSLTSQQALTTNWTGSEVVYRPTLWILNRAPVTQQNGNTLTLDNANASYDISDGWGFFIQKHPATLDQNGEWYYDPSSKAIQLYSDLDPNSQTITATVYGQGVRMLNNKYVSVRNLKITQQLNVGLYAANISNTTVSDNEIYNIGEDGMLIHGNGTNVTIKNNQIKQVYNNGTEVQSYTALTYSNNVVSQVGLRPGRGKSGDGQYRGVDISVTTNCLFETNVLDSIGYTGMSFSTQTSGLTIRRNTISNYLLTKSDGGGIYTFNGYKLPMDNIKIQSNIVSNASAANEGAIVGSTFTGANGIYLDGCVNGIEVSDNTVYNCRGIGIFMIAAYNNTIVRNNSFNNGESQLVLAAGTDCPPRNNTIQYNIFTSVLPTTATARYESNANDLNQYGAIDYNYYIRPLDNGLVLNAAFKDNGIDASNPVGLRDWQRLFGKDANAKTSPITYKGYTLNATTGNNRIENSNFDSNALNWYTQSYYNNFRIDWDNTNKLDGGSMKLSFQPSSGYRASYGFVFGNAYPVVKGRSYILRFDAVASANGKTIQAYIRQRNAPAVDLATRSSAVVNTARQKYEFAFTALQDDNDPILLFSVLEDDQSLWIDNITLQEADITRDQPNSLIKLAVNNTVTDSIINLDGLYRDVNGTLYNRQITLAAFTSSVLLKDTAATVDLSLNLLAEKVTTQVGATTSFTVNIVNQGTVNPNRGASAQWVCRLPANVQFVGGSGVSNNNGTLTGQTPLLYANNVSTFVFQCRTTQPGNYSIGAEIDTESIYDYDSRPRSGISDGEDDSQQLLIRTTGTTSALYSSPDPNRRNLPRATLNEPAPYSTLADLRLNLKSDVRSIALNKPLSYTATVTNIGGTDAQNVQLQVQLPTGMTFIGGTGWSVNNSILVGNVGSVIAGGSQSLEFRVTPTAKGYFVVQSQIFLSDPGDPDSQAGNGYTNGEDDQSATDIRVF